MADVVVVALANYCLLTIFWMSLIATYIKLNLRSLWLIGAGTVLSVIDSVRVFIIDFDVFHGNGTNDAFYDDPDVIFFFSSPNCVPTRPVPIKEDQQHQQLAEKSAPTLTEVRPGEDSYQGGGTRV
ncbi:hypothetical protein CTI12_AA207370 [Artemisia annua]|uniref:Histone deacetylase domain-containing protein n=1 Tax=Artemisia annua TaxID=35608 RepID=A0A2U1P0N0_ARTAN|nr:hypothetical protein CTI12_AA207370 [Artemisia annua]